MASLTSVLAQTPAERVEWARTPEAFAGKWVAARLASGTRIEGHWVSVTPEAFTMKVEKTSDKAEVSKGTRELARSALVQVKSGKRRARGRVIGTIAGYFAGVVIGNLAGDLGGAAIGALTGLVGGHLVGRASDRAMHEVVLLP